MPKRTPEDDLGGQSSHLQKEAKRVQGSVPYQKWVASYEGEKENNGLSSSTWPEVDPDRCYQVAGKIVKGCEFPDNVLPVNAESVNPSLVQRIRVELRLAAGKLYR